VTRTGEDSTTAADITGQPAFVGGYVNGLYKWADADWTRFPHSHRVEFNVTGDPSIGNAIDIERGDATPADGPPWWDNRTKAGVANLAVYVNQGNLATVRQLMGGRHYFLILATLDGRNVPYPGVAAVQWEGQAQTGQHHDTWTVWDDHWYPEALPTTITVPAAVRQVAASAATTVAQLAQLTSQITRDLG
jgi:hypothetical protein